METEFEDKLKINNDNAKKFLEEKNEEPFNLNIPIKTNFTNQEDGQQNKYKFIYINCF